MPTLPYGERRRVLIGLIGERAVARCQPEVQPDLLQPLHVTPMNCTGRVMTGWLYRTGPSTSKEAGLRTWMTRGETVRSAPTRKPGGGTR